MASIEVTIGGKAFDNLIAAFDQLGENVEQAVEQSIQAVAPMLLSSLYNVARKLQSMHSASWNGSVFNSGDSLQRRSGGGLQSIYRSIKLLEKGGDLVSARISAGSLSFHEEGGTIKAKSAQYLTIPLPAAMDSRGVPLKERARQWDNTFVKRSKKGNLLIFRRLPGARELTPLYILKTSVYVRPRLRMEPTLLDEMSYFDQRLFDKISNIIDQYV